MSIIFIENLKIEALHGLKRRERNKPQLFIVDIWVNCNTHKAERTDDIDDTLNYARLELIAKEVLAGKPSNLLERLAAEMADRIMEDKRARGVKVQIRKAQIWDDGVPGIILERKRRAIWG